MVYWCHYTVYLVSNRFYFMNHYLAMWYTHTHMYTHTFVCLCTHTHACKHTHIYTYTCTYAHTCAHTRTYMHTHMRAHTHSDTHTYIHTNAHTHKRTHTHFIVKEMTWFELSLFLLKENCCWELKDTCVPLTCTCSHLVPCCWPTAHTVRRTPSGCGPSMTSLPLPPSPWTMRFLVHCSVSPPFRPPLHPPPLSIQSPPAWQPGEQG